MLSPGVFASLFACCALGCGAAAHAPPETRVERELREPRDASGRIVVYASEGNLLHTHALHTGDGSLTPVSTLALPQPIHYAAADARSSHLYVSVSNGADLHALHALAIDPESGVLVEHGAPLVPTDGRIIHLSVDAERRHLVLAHNRTARVSSVRLNPDGSLGAPVPQPVPVSAGFYTHQASIDERGTGVVVCGLGAAATATSAEEPGSLTVFAFEAGVLTPRQAIVLGTGLGPRHLAYRGDRVYVAAERGNRLLVYDYRSGVLAERPRFDVATLIDPDNVRPRQRAGAIHLHPSGRYLYVSNRADATALVSVGGQSVEAFAGGENNIVVYQLLEPSGEPRPIEHQDTRGVEPRTFTIDPTGQFLIVANQSTRNVLAGDVSALAVTPLSRSLVVFRIEGDGRLSFVRKYDASAGELFWVQALALPGVDGAPPRR